MMFILFKKVKKGKKIMINFLKYTHTLENLYSDFCSIKPPILGIFLDLTRHLDP